MKKHNSHLYIIKNLRQIFAGKTILDIPYLELEQGKTYALIGRNGAGKTTLLKIMAFLEEPTCGEVLFMGEKALAVHKMREKVVWLAQMPLLFSSTVLYNVCYPMLVRGVSREERTKTALGFLEKVGLLHMAKASAHTLSGGEAQRVCIARALATSAKVLLLDEPTAGLDTTAQQALLQTITNLSQNKEFSIILTSHDEEFLSQLCQEHIYLEAGKIVTQKELQESGEIFWTDSRLELELNSKININTYATVKGLEVCEKGITLLVSTDSRVFKILLSSPASIAIGQKICLGQNLHLL